MKILLLLLKNNLIQLCRLNQLRYADNQKRRNTIYLYIFVGTILIGGLVYLSYSLNIVFSLSWTLDEKDEYSIGNAERSWELFERFYRRRSWENRERFGEVDYSLVIRT